MIVDRNNADQLIKFRSIWNSIFKSKYVVKNEVWHQFIVNYVNVKQFQDMKKLQFEIETYNDIKFKFASRWLSKNMNKKIHSSIVIIVTTNKNAFKMKNMLNIESVHCKSNVYSSIQSTTQCTRCQKFNHLYVICKNQKKCDICVQNHETKQHICSICQFKTVCLHIAQEYVNFNELYVSKSNTCEIFTTLKIKSRSIIVEEKL